MQTIWTRLARAYPTKDDDKGGDVVSLRRSIVGETRPALLVPWGAVGVVLIIACTNVANLLLARAVTRQREMAIRSALGASRVDLIRASIVDAVLLALLGGVSGIGLAGWGIRALIALRPDGTNSIAGAALDTRVLLVSLAISLGAGLAAGLLPALQMEPRRDVNKAKRALAITELALAVVLLTSAGLLLRTFAALRSVDLGYQTDNRLIFDVALPDVRYDSPEKRAAFFVSLTDALRALPGVRDVAAATGLPLSGYSFSMSAYALDGVKLSDDEQPTTRSRGRASSCCRGADPRNRRPHGARRASGPGAEPRHQGRSRDRDDRRAGRGRRVARGHAIAPRAPVRRELRRFVDARGDVRARRRRDAGRDVGAGVAREPGGSGRGDQVRVTTSPGAGAVTL